MLYSDYSISKFYIFSLFILPIKNSKKSFTTVLFIHTSDYLRYLKKNCNPLAHPT